MKEVTPATRRMSEAESRQSRPLPRTVWLLSWVSFFADVSGEMIYPLLPLFLVGVLGSSKTQLGMIEGAAVLLVAVMTAFAGVRSDRTGTGRVPWIRWGYGLPVLGKATIALATVWPLVLFGRLLDRFGKGLRSAPRDALITDAVTADQRGRAFGLHRAFDTAGAFVGVLLSAWLLWWLTGTPQQGDVAVAASSVAQTPVWIYRAIFGVGAGLGLAALILTIFVHESAGGSAAPPSPATPGVATPSTNATSSTGWLALPRSYWSVLMLLSLFSLANSSDVFLLLRASDLGYSPWSVVMLYAVYNLTYSALAYPAGMLSDRLGRWGIIAIGWVIYSGVYVGFAFLPDTHAWGLWPLMASYGVYMALTDGVGKALIADHAPRAKRGTAMGIFYAVSGLMTLGASVLAGIMWDRFGPTLAFSIGAGLSVLALVVLAALRWRTAFGAVQ